MEPPLLIPRKFQSLLLRVWIFSGATLELTNLKSSWAPVHELNSPLSLDGGNSSIDIFGYNITSIQQTACHILAMTRITLYHLVCWFKASIGDLSHTELLMVGLLGRDDRCICSQREVNSWIRHQVGLEFHHILKLNWLDSNVHIIQTYLIIMLVR